MAGDKLGEFGGQLDQPIPSEALRGTCRDYLEREYTQAGGSAKPAKAEMI